MIRKKGWKQIWMSALLAITLLAATACTGGKNDTGSENEEVEIPIILIVDSSTGIKNEEKLIQKFNRLYAGKWRAQAQWIMETEEEYRQNLKRQNATDTLPAVITDLRMLPSFYYMMEEDGSIYLNPLSTAAFACSGMFWNEELFQQAGIEKFPETWEEFWDCCEQLERHGITPLALHTEGTAWAPMLIATAEVGSTAKGADFMQQFYPETYQNDSGMQIAETLQRLFTYTTGNALYVDFDVSYENFFSGEAAMIPNGYWMMDQIPEEWADKVRFSAFPENTLIGSPETFGWSIVSSYDEEVKEGAAALLKLRTELNMQEKERLFESNQEELTPAERDYIEAYKNHKRLIPNYQVKWNSILQEEVLGEILPELAQGKITPEEFVKREDESIAQYLDEQ